MHLPRRARLFVFVLITLLAASFSTRGSTAEPAKAESPIPLAKPKFRLAVEEVIPPEFQFEITKLKEMRERSKQGLISQSEVSVQANAVDALQRRTTYLITLRSEGGTLGELMKVTSGTNTGVSLTLINAGEPSDLDSKL